MLQVMLQVMFQVRASSLQNASLLLNALLLLLSHLPVRFSFFIRYGNRVWIDERGVNYVYVEREGQVARRRVHATTRVSVQVDRKRLHLGVASCY